MGWLTVASFIWKFVIPSTKEVVRVIGADTFNVVYDAVLEMQESEETGLEKRSKVFSVAFEYLMEEKKIKDLGIFGATAIYFMIEIAVLNMKLHKEK